MKSGMTIHTEDGYNLFVLSDGSVVDNVTDPDLSWVSLADFIDSYDGSFVIHTRTTTINVER